MDELLCSDDICDPCIGPISLMKLSDNIYEIFMDLDKNIELLIEELKDGR